MGFIQQFKESCMSGSKMSSKRVIMYTFALVAVFMIAVEALFNLLIIFEWIKVEKGQDGLRFEMVFDSIIYGYVFGIVGALAGINGWSDKGKKNKENGINTDGS